MNEGRYNSSKNHKQQRSSGEVEGDVEGRKVASRKNKNYYVRTVEAVHKDANSGGEVANVGNLETTTETYSSL